MLYLKNIWYFERNNTTILNFFEDLIKHALCKFKEIQMNSVFFSFFDYFILNVYWV